MIGVPYILTQNDVHRGIHALATKLLDGHTQWEELVSFNQLSPPYITLDASDIYGPPLANLSLSSQLALGSDTITVYNQPRNITTVYLSQAGATGLISEAIAVASYDGQTITLSTPTRNGYFAGARLQLFSTYNLKSKVLLPGNIMFVPVENTSGNFALTDNLSFVDAFGSDIDASFGFENGDIKVVSGLATFLQRMTVALKTEVGSLPLYLLFGSRLNQTIGTPPTSAKWKAVINECLVRLPEVDRVTDTQVNISGDKVYITSKVWTKTSKVPIQLVNEAFSILNAAI